MSDEKSASLAGNVGRRVKSGAKNTFEGEPGSAFWLIEQFVLWVRRVVASVNEYLSARRVTRTDAENDE